MTSTPAPHEAHWLIPLHSRNPSKNGLIIPEAVWDKAIRDWMRKGDPHLSIHQENGYAMVIVHKEA
jgi:hypothetical protein